MYEDPLTQKTTYVLETYLSLEALSSSLFIAAASFSL